MVILLILSTALFILSEELAEIYISTPFIGMSFIISHINLIICAIFRRGSMCSTFRMSSAASGRRLCDINRELFIVTKSRVKKLGNLGAAKINRL